MHQQRYRIGLVACLVMAFVSARLLAQAANPAVEQAVKLKDQHKLDQAIAKLNGVLKSNPKDGRAHYVLAWTLIHKNKRDQAAGQFQQAIAANITGDDLTLAQGALQRMGKAVAVAPSGPGGPPGGAPAGPPSGSKIAAAPPGAPPGGKAPAGPPSVPPGAGPPGGGAPGGPPAASKAGGPPGAPAGPPGGGPPGAPGAGPPGAGPPGGSPPPGAPGAKSSGEPVQEEPEKKPLPVPLLIGVPAAVILGVTLVLQKKNKAKKTE